MSERPPSSHEQSVSQAYSCGHACHGDIGLEPGQFESRLLSVIEKSVGTDAKPDAIDEFVKSLHLCDLYLAVACALNSARAWDCFGRLYQKYINDLAFFASPSSDAAYELAASVQADMFLPDRSGQSRIASYDGRSSLATWLRAVVSHRAINERQRKFNTLERIDVLPEMADDDSLDSLEASLRADRYGLAISDAFEHACSGLSERERLLLLMRYDEELQVSQIARLLGVHPSTITRQIDRVQEKLRNDIIAQLTDKHRLCPDATRECVADILENPSHSILAFVRAGRMG